MTREKAIERLCKLQCSLATHVGLHYTADCFCENGYHTNTRIKNYLNDGHAIAFIEEAVAEKLERIKAEKTIKLEELQNDN